MNLQERKIKEIKKHGIFDSRKDFYSTLRLSNGKKVAIDKDYIYNSGKGRTNFKSFLKIIEDILFIK